MKKRKKTSFQKNYLAPISLQRVEQALLRLGFRKIGRQDHGYRRREDGQDGLHVILREKSARIELHVHMDRVGFGRPAYRHRTVPFNPKPLFKSLDRELKSA